MCVRIVIREVPTVRAVVADQYTSTIPLAYVNLHVPSNYVMGHQSAQIGLQGYVDIRMRLPEGAPR